jgi:hypothetical protein
MEKKRCVICNKPLSEYNKNDQCFSHTRTLDDEDLEQLHREEAISNMIHGSVLGHYEDQDSQAEGPNHRISRDWRGVINLDIWGVTS